MTTDLFVLSVIGDEFDVTWFSTPHRQTALGPNATVIATDGNVRVTFRAPCQEWRVGDRISWTQYRTKVAA